MTKLHLDALAKKAKHSKKALRVALANLPLDLDKTYEDAMARISAQEEEDAHLAVQVLSWVLMSFRRMTVRELQEALAVQSDYEENDEESLIDPEFFISVCGGLLVLDRGGYVDWISFVHLTTEEFFERNTEKYFPQAGFQVSSICLKQLTKRSINLKKLTRSPETAMNEFTEYAVRYAVLHVNASSEPGLFTAITFLWESDHLGTIRQAFDYLTSDGTTLTDHEEKSLIHPYSIFASLQLAVMFNLDMEAEEMIREGFTEDSFDVPDTARPDLPILIPFSETKIPVVCIAIHNRNFQILELLLDAGARLDVVMIDRKGSTLTALECAIAREDQEMVQFLLRRSPTLTDYRPIQGRTALHFAVSSQLHELASYLMSGIVGLSVDEKDENGQTPLHHLVKAEPRPQSRNLMPTFQSLLRASATINAYDVVGKTPLDYCRKIWDRSDQNYELYNTLVSQGAIESWGKKLQAALSSGFQSEAQRLLDENANTNALPESIQHGLLRLLLSRKLVVTPDAESVIRVDCSLAGTLIDLGATIQSLVRGETDLHWIINHLGELRQQSGILPYNSTLDIFGAKGQMMISDERSMKRYEMAKRTHLHVLNKLISTVGNVDVKFIGITPLFQASRNGEVEIVELLLSNGADDSMTGPFGRPIDVAARYCHPRVVEMLLARRPSVPRSLLDFLQSASPRYYPVLLTFPRDRHETMWLLCAYNGWDFPRSSDAKRLQEREAQTKEFQERRARGRRQGRQVRIEEFQVRLLRTKKVN
jgi:ankyrin repeat protein